MKYQKQLAAFIERKADKHKCNHITACKKVREDFERSITRMSKEIQTLQVNHPTKHEINKLTTLTKWKEIEKAWCIQLGVIEAEMISGMM